MTTEAYIEQYKDIAIKKMKEYRIPASITLAQGILESGSGNSRLAREANNHFGIKCHKDWTGKTIYMDDDEKDECFRKYPKAEDSYNDHSLFLTQRGRYSFLFDYKTTDYKSWAHGLKKAGYATNPKYPELLIRLIDKYDLSQYDSPTSRRHKKKNEESATTVAAATGPITKPELKPISQTGPQGRKMYEINGVKLILAKQGDTDAGLAEEFNIYSWQIRAYNDLDKKHVIQQDEIIFLEKKKNKAGKSFKYHVVVQGETLQYISQIYGVRLKKLLNKNNLPEGIQVPAGTQLKLR
jgi:LysM repeat protein